VKKQGVPPLPEVILSHELEVDRYCAASATVPTSLLLVFVLKRRFNKAPGADVVGGVDGRPPGDLGIS